MPKVTALFWDVGGVILSNGWDRDTRRAMARAFRLDEEDFENRHELVAGRFETGRMSLDRYLERTIFYAPRAFTPQDVTQYILAQSRALAGSLDLLARLAATRQYLLATLNNESRELNLHRIEKFGLRKYFSVFFSSCFLGVQKPDDDIYRLALEMTQRSPEETVFIDDRSLNVECARHCGMNAIQFHEAAQLERDLRGMGVVGIP
jgi:putative hydrolase of the HAD superfamily